MQEVQSLMKTYYLIFLCLFDAILDSSVIPLYIFKINKVFLLSEYKTTETKPLKRTTIVFHLPIKNNQTNMET